MRNACLAILLCVFARTTFACAPAPHAGDEIAIVEESALIVWDPAATTEHFIRRATFRGKGRDFGFLVPTPSVPTLAEADDNIFGELTSWAQPPVKYVTTKTIDWSSLLLGSLMRKEMNTVATAGVEVLSNQQIAGYEAAVLEASDSAALQKWLSEHGYEANHDLNYWLDAYIAQRWKITAFKIAATNPDARTGAVKMSFVTPRPFFPYREPQSQRTFSSQLNRTLHVFFLGPERVNGTIGSGTEWPAELKRSENLTAPLHASIAKATGLTLPASLRLTAFEDWLAVRPGMDDLFFSRVADQSPFIPEPRIVENVNTTRIPLDIVILAFIVLVALPIYLRARSRRHEHRGL
jgi:hypothetical protein